MTRRSALLLKLAAIITIATTVVASDGCIRASNKLIRSKGKHKQAAKAAPELHTDHSSPLS